MKNALGKLTFLYSLSFLLFCNFFPMFFVFNFLLVNFLAWKQHLVNLHPWSKTEHFHTVCRKGKLIFANIYQSQIVWFWVPWKTEAPSLLNIMWFKFSYTANPKCRLYWCIIELVDWSNSQSCWYFQPLLWTSAPLTFSMVHLLPPPFPLWISTTAVCTVFIKCVTGRGDRGRQTDKHPPPSILTSQFLREADI